MAIFNYYLFYSILSEIIYFHIIIIKKNVINKSEKKTNKYQFNNIYLR